MVTGDDEDVGTPEGPPEEAIKLPIDGTLDLHTFHPRDVPSLVPEYIEECRRRGIFEVRIVHGKGTGALRRAVHGILDRLPDVLDYRLGGAAGGEWGATIARLRPMAPEEPR